MTRTLTYAGKNLSDFGVWWDNSRIFNKPAKLYESFSIPNRNGALLTSLRRYDNIQIEYDCFIKDNFATNYANLVDYLTSFDTYQRLENSEESTTYRLGVFRSEISVDSGQFLKDGQFTLVFDCKPQNFFKTGDELTQLVVNPLHTNYWSDSDFTLGNIPVTYSDGEYTLSGYQYNSTGATYYTQIAIPSAGTWTITMTITTPDYNGIGAATTVSLDGTIKPLNRFDVIRKVKTTTGASSVPLRWTIDMGVYGTLNAKVEVYMSKQNEQTELVNPSYKKSRPLIIYEEVGTATQVVVNNVAFFEYTPPAGAADSDGTLYVDCELMDCYLLRSNGSTANYNPYVELDSDFPELTAGSNYAWTTNGTVYIKPRWWRL